MRSAPVSGVRPSRRAVIAGATIGAALASTGCSPRSAPKPYRYGSMSEEQYGLLMLPPGEIKGTVVFWHGGLWLQAHPVTEHASEWQFALAERGYASWALEYRRIGSNGGFPHTFEDVAVGMDFLTKLNPDVPGVDSAALTRNVILAGYSSGGQLAVWAASRRDFTPGGPPQLKARAVVGISAPLTMTAITSMLGPGPVTDFMGGFFSEVPDHYYLGDPSILVPANMPVHLLQPTRDQYVAPQIAETYCAASRAAGGTCELELMEGEHLKLGTALAPTWPVILGKFEELLT